MVSYAQNKDISAFLKAGSSAAAAGTNGNTYAGTAFDARDYQSALLTLAVGSATGSPTSYSVTVTIEESDASGSGYAAVSGFELAADDGDGAGAYSLPINLSARKRYVRVSVAIVTAGGTSPTVPFGTILVGSGGYDLPTS